MYRIIAKIDGLNGIKHVKYHKVSDLKRFEKFLDTKFKRWFYFNVYSSKNGHHLASFTKKDRPRSARIRT